MEKLVSVIIPCFNAEKWLIEAIDSCLKQSYLKIEIIVVDDGSTDNSLEIMKGYADKIIWETGPNRGGNHARNRGFALSSGDYIQYLDADDYLLPEKIERQVRFLEETGADVVYGDWRYRQHLPDGTSFLDDINVSGPKEDFLESLLANHQWVPPVALLYTRALVKSCDGWDENLRAGQDRDFLISVALSGAKIVYQHGCYSIYRKYGNTSTSTSNRQLLLKSHWLLMEKAETKLVQLDKFSSKYRQALARGYLLNSRRYSDYISYSQHLSLLKKILRVYPKFKGDGSVGYSLVQIVFGFLVAEVVINLKRRLISKCKKLAHS